MPPQRADKVTYTTKVTRREIEFVEKERSRRGKRHISAVVEAVLRDLLTDPGFRTAPLAIPPTHGEDLVDVSYRLSPELVGLVREATLAHRSTAQQIVRAAIHALEQRAADIQNPNQTKG